MLRTIFFSLALLCLTKWIDCDMLKKNVVLELKQDAVLDCSSVEGEVEFFSYRGTEPAVPLPVNLVDKKVATLKALKKVDIETDYKCLVKDANTVKGIEFVKEIKPFLLMDNDGQSQTITEGGRVDFSCSMFVFGSLEGLEWSWTGPNKTHQDLVADKEKVTIVVSDDKSTSTLQVKNVSRDYKGHFKCIIKNAFGEHSREFQLRVKDALAALWPFLAIVAEVIILCVIILVYEKKCAKKSTATDEDNEQSQNLMGNNNPDVKKRIATKA